VVRRDSRGSPGFPWFTGNPVVRRADPPPPRVIPGWAHRSPGSGCRRHGDAGCPASLTPDLDAQIPCLVEAGDFRRDRGRRHRSSAESPVSAHRSPVSRTWGRADAGRPASPSRPARTNLLTHRDRGCPSRPRATSPVSRRFPCLGAQIPGLANPGRADARHHRRARTPHSSRQGMPVETEGHALSLAPNPLSRRADPRSRMPGAGGRRAPGIPIPTGAHEPPHSPRHGTSV